MAVEESKATIIAVKSDVKCIFAKEDYVYTKRRSVLKRQIMVYVAGHEGTDNRLQVLFMMPGRSCSSRGWKSPHSRAPLWLPPVAA